MSDSRNWDDPKICKESDKEVDEFLKAMAKDGRWTSNNVIIEKMIEEFTPEELINWGFMRMRDQVIEQELGKMMSNLFGNKPPF
jgi:hypothetical protein